MHTKLTLRLEEELIDQAKSYAARSGKSVSQVVADYFRLLPEGRGQVGKLSGTPLTRSLRGVLRGVSADVDDYRQHLEAKHR